MTPAISLKHDGWIIDVLARGGGLARCDFRGQAILQSTPQSPFVTGIAAAVCYYPLLPFFNRIRDGRLAFDGRAIQVEPTVRGHPHALHGHGWHREWQWLRADAAACALSFEHAPAAGWPWRYGATETFSLRANVLTIELRLQNLSDDTMPAGIGFYPFFPRLAAARLHARAHRLSDRGAEQFPRASGEIPLAWDFRDARPVRDANGLDHCYSGWDGLATIEWMDAQWRVELAADTLEHLHLYVAEDRDFFCVEPVSHGLDAFNYPESRNRAALTLRAGEELTATLAIRCVARDASAAPN